MRALHVLTAILVVLVSGAALFLYIAFRDMESIFGGPMSADDIAHIDSDAAEAKLHQVWFVPARTAFVSPKLAALARAACAGDVAGEQRAIKSGADPNGGDKDQDYRSFELDHITPLLFALDCRNVRGIAALLQLGADPNRSRPGRPYSSGGEALNVAADMDDPAFLKAMLDHGGNPNGDSWPLRVALEHGYKTNNWTNYDLLLDAGADINRAYDDQTVATVANDYDRFDKIEDLLKRGYRHDLMHLAVDMNSPRFRALSPEKSAARERVYTLLKQDGVPFPLLTFWERYSGTARPLPDGSLQVEWYGTSPGAQIYRTYKRGDPEFSSIAKRMGQHAPDESRDIVRQRDDPFP